MINIIREHSNLPDVGMAVGTDVGTFVGTNVGTVGSVDGGVIVETVIAIKLTLRKGL